MPTLNVGNPFVATSTLLEGCSTCPLFRESLSTTPRDVVGLCFPPTWRGVSNSLTIEWYYVLVLYLTFAFLIFFFLLCMKSMMRLYGRDLPGYECTWYTHSVTSHSSRWYSLYIFKCSRSFLFCFLSLLFRSPYPARFFSSVGLFSGLFFFLLHAGLLGHHPQAQARPSSRCKRVGLHGRTSGCAAHAVASPSPPGNVAVRCRVVVKTIAAIYGKYQLRRRVLIEARFVALYPCSFPYPIS